MLATLDSPPRVLSVTSGDYSRHSDLPKHSPVLFFVVGAATATSVLLGAPAAVPSVANATSIVQRTPATTTPRVVESTAETVRRVRERSGLTWDQFAKAFNVSRRAAHHWASGGNLSASNSALLVEFDRLLTAVDSTDPSEVRGRLVSADSSGESPLEAFRKLALSAFAEAQPRVIALEAALDPS